MQQLDFVRTFCQSKEIIISTAGTRQRCWRVAWEALFIAVLPHVANTKDSSSQDRE